MNRFDDELRHATRPLAGAPLPPDLLDEALDAPSVRPRWAAFAAAASLAAVLVIAAGIGIGRMPTPLPNPSVSPSSVALPSAQAASTCEDVAAPTGGEDIVLVYFPCGIGLDREPSSGTRSVGRDMPVTERLETALRAVLDGPSELERAQGMLAVVPEGSGELLAGITLESDGLVEADFTQSLSEVDNLSTSARSGAFLRAMRATALQFDEVTALELRIDGSCDAFFEHLQSTCQHFAKPVDQVSDCAIIPPAELPSGAPITEARPYPGEPMVSWGSGHDTVTELPGHRDGGPSVDGGTPVMVRGYAGSVQPSGDLPLPAPMQIGWVEEGCPYLVFTRFPGGEDAAVEYAARFGPVVAEAQPIGAGSLARVNAAAAVLDEPQGAQFGLLEPDHDVLVVGVQQMSDGDWYRIEFEHCCRADASSSEWVFGWVAADLERAGLREPGFGIDAPQVLAGPTLEEVDWSCPAEPEQLYRLAEPVRRECYNSEPITMRGSLDGGQRGQALYPGDPAWLTGLPFAALVPSSMETGYRHLPLHFTPGDPLLLAWLNDERVKRYEEVEVTGSFGSGALGCTKTPRLAGLPPMSAEEQQLWCDQQFTVTDIHGDGPDPVINAPLADPLWIPPPGVQPEAGDGWRLLSSADSSHLAITVVSGMVEVATDPQSYQRLWLSMARGDAPAVDFDREFVVQFVASVSGSCPWVAFTGIGVDSVQGVLFGRLENLSAELFIAEVPDNFGCTTDATPHAFLVAVQRSVAPATDFRVRLEEERLCDDCGITTDEMVVRLSE